MDPDRVTDLVQDRLDAIILVISLFVLLPSLTLIGLWNSTAVLDTTEMLTLLIQWFGISVSGILSGLLVYGYFLFASIQQDQTTLMEQSHQPSLDLEISGIMEDTIIIDLENMGNGIAHNISVVSLVTVYRDGKNNQIETNADSGYLPGNSPLSSKGSALSRTGSSLGPGSKETFVTVPRIWEDKDEDDGRRGIPVSDVTENIDNINGLSIRFVLRYQSMSGETMFSPGFRISLPIRLGEVYTSDMDLEDIVQEGNISGDVTETDIEQAEEHLLLTMFTTSRARAN